jgi:hypothetical protein
MKQIGHSEVGDEERGVGGRGTVGGGLAVVLEDVLGFTVLDGDALVNPNKSSAQERRALNKVVDSGDGGRETARRDCPAGEDHEGGTEPLLWHRS